MLRDEFSNKELIQEYFGTTDEEELLQKKLEFLLRKIGTINRHSNNVGDVEAIAYYEKIIRQILGDNLYQQRIKFHKCFKEVNGRRQICDILVLKKESEQIYYIFDNEDQEYQRVEIEELRNKPIYLHDKENDKSDIQEYIARNDSGGFELS